ncbi:hypothetical protein JCM10207_000207 [Rhodosporidiobolus poonsookiae]
MRNPYKPRSRRTSAPRVFTERALGIMLHARKKEGGHVSIVQKEINYALNHGHALQQPSLQALRHMDAGLFERAEFEDFDENDGLQIAVMATGYHTSGTEPDHMQVVFLEYRGGHVLVQHWRDTTGGFGNDEGNAWLRSQHATFRSYKTVADNWNAIVQNTTAQPFEQIAHLAVEFLLGLPEGHPLLNQHNALFPRDPTAVFQ